MPEKNQWKLEMNRRKKLLKRYKEETIEFESLDDLKQKMLELSDPVKSNPAYLLIYNMDLSLMYVYFNHIFQKLNGYLLKYTKKDFFFISYKCIFK